MVWLFMFLPLSELCWSKLHFVLCTELRLMLQWDPEWVPHYWIHLPVPVTVKGKHEVFSVSKTIFCWINSNTKNSTDHSSHLLYWELTIVNWQPALYLSVTVLIALWVLAVIQYIVLNVSHRALGKIRTSCSDAEMALRMWNLVTRKSKR